MKELDEIKERSKTPTDMSDHLVTLFVETLSLHPKLIVELGVRGGESTFALIRAAQLCNSKMISVDKKDITVDKEIFKYDNWEFVLDDDIEFAEYFINSCDSKRIHPSIDLLFIDTDHKYEHTVQEIRSWFPFLSSKCKVIFHDTNSFENYKMKDGSTRTGGRGETRGVIRALENYFKTNFQEVIEFTDIIDGWLIKHVPYCCGLTILERLK